MSESDKNSKNLVERISSFIEQEREMYGDFAVNNADAASTSRDSNEDEAPTSSASNMVSEPDVQAENESSENTKSDSASSQEGLFNDDDSTDVYQKIDECDSLEELEQLCERADTLRTDLDDTRLVFGTGNTDADLVIIGEAPGANEDKQGEPFVGKAGKLLNKILGAIDFKREEVYITNILKHRPPNNRNPKPEERKRSLPFLLRQIDLIDPKLILSLGKVSAQTLLDKKGSLKSMRKQFHTFKGNYQLLATYHPAALLRNKKWKRPTWEDVQLLRNKYDELGGQP